MLYTPLQVYITAYHHIMYVPLHTVQWLDNASSLDGNGVNEGDTLLLRKKFFILNDDITEAIAGNEELKELIYQQVHSATKHVVYNMYFTHSTFFL